MKQKKKGAPTKAKVQKQKKKKKNRVTTSSIARHESIINKDTIRPIDKGDTLDT